MHNLPLDDLNMHTFKNRSTPYSIEPIGIGTKMVESLTSYLIRLSEAHNFRFSVLLLNFLFPILKMRNNSYTFNHFTHRFNVNLDGNGALTMEIIEILETLTNRKDLSYLTLISWSGIASSDSISYNSKWCPHCLYEMKKERGILYHPLLWEFKIVNSCHIHDTHLSSRCPACNNEQHVLERKTGKIGFCKYCKAWLGELKYQKKNYEKKEIGEYSRWLSNSLGELLAIAPKVRSLPTKNILRKVVTDINEYYSDLSPFNYRLKEYIYNEKNYEVDIFDSFLSYFEEILSKLYYIGAPIQIIYDYSIFDPSKIAISDKVNHYRDRVLKEIEVERKFVEILVNGSRLPSADQLIKLTGDRYVLTLLYDLLYKMGITKEEFESKDIKNKFN